MLFKKKKQVIPDYCLSFKEAFLFFSHILNPCFFLFSESSYLCVCFIVLQRLVRKKESLRISRPPPKIFVNILYVIPYANVSTFFIYCYFMIYSFFFGSLWLKKKKEKKSCHLHAYTINPICKNICTVFSLFFFLCIDFLKGPDAVGSSFCFCFFLFLQM